MSRLPPLSPVLSCRDPIQPRRNGAVASPGVQVLVFKSCCSSSSGNRLPPSGVMLHGTFPNRRARCATGRFTSARLLHESVCPVARKSDDPRPDHLRACSIRSLPSSRMNMFRMVLKRMRVRFRRLCGHSAAQFSQLSRAIRTGFWNLLSGTLSFRKPRPRSRQPGGSIPLNQYYAVNVVVPGRYSKRFFCDPTGLYRGERRNVRARGTPPRSARGRPWGARPAACASRSTSSLWCWPISRTSVPPSASRPAAWRTIRR